MFHTNANHVPTNIHVTGGEECRLNPYPEAALNVQDSRNQSGVARRRPTRRFSSRRRLWMSGDRWVDIRRWWCAFLLTTIISLGPLRNSTDTLETAECDFPIQIPKLLTLSPACFYTYVFSSSLRRAEKPIRGITCMYIAGTEETPLLLRNLKTQRIRWLTV